MKSKKKKTKKKFKFSSIVKTNKQHLGNIHNQYLVELKMY